MALLRGNTVVTLKPGHGLALYGMAIDLGTTTIVATLFDLTTGSERAVATSLNPQVEFGDDVVSRISRIRDDHTALGQLQRTVVKALNTLIRASAQKARITVQRIYEIVICGNSTMQQILCGLDPSGLGVLPFVQVSDDALSIPAPRLSIAASTHAEVFVFPQIGGFIGGDTVAGMLAAHLDRAERPTLFVDIGTNGEIVLAHQGRLIATSTAAGPAFEGARITQGMRATTGAIEKVVLRDDVYFNVIGNSRPMGLCGTALIDVAAELLRHGMMDQTGRILSREELPSHVPESLRVRLVSMNGTTGFMLVAANRAASNAPICLWQKDIRELQLAMGAIRAGINLLLRRAALIPHDLGEVLLAGALGNFIRRSNACRIGLLPQIPLEHITFIGNAASMGAKLALLSVEERAYGMALSDKTEHIDLSLDPEFQTEFALAMMFPDQETNECAN
jgi:uncharacterized 2Fe-2S/4Fe-4S cluster protein (DUF4445 family)